MVIQSYSAFVLYCSSTVYYLGWYCSTMVQQCKYTVQIYGMVQWNAVVVVQYDTVVLQCYVQILLYYILYSVVLHAAVRYYSITLCSIVWRCSTTVLRCLSHSTTVQQWYSTLLYTIYSSTNFLYYSSNIIYYGIVSTLQSDTTVSKYKLQYGAVVLQY